MLGAVLGEASDEEDEGEEKDDKCCDPRGDRLWIDDGGRHVSATLLQRTENVYD